jgi:hypothetical protein
MWNRVAQSHPYEETPAVLIRLGAFSEGRMPTGYEGEGDLMRQDLQALFAIMKEPQDGSILHQYAQLKLCAAGAKRMEGYQGSSAMQQDLLDLFKWLREPVIITA